jgi:hypothetical protein
MDEAAVTVPPPGSPYWKLTSHIGPLLTDYDQSSQDVEAEFAAGLLASWDPQALAAGLARMTVMLHRMGQEMFEVEQTLGKALGYPEYTAEFFPDGVPDGSVCSGELTPGLIAREAADRIRDLKAELEQTEQWAEEHGRTITKLEGQLQVARKGQADDPALLSRLLWDAREIVEMFEDIAERRTRKPNEWTRRLITDIDAYRAGRGWSPDGFGGETA